MIDWNDFETAVVDQLGRDIREQRNPNQNEAIRSNLDQSLFIVAGPGSGKTTVIALRVLKLIFVNDIDPSNILVTTFTRKAAAELTSRILSWGDQLRHIFLSNPSYHHIKNRLQLDFNKIIIGTLDSIAEEALGATRAPGTPAPVVIEDFVSNALMIRVGLFAHGRHNNQDLKGLIAQLRGTSWGLNVAEISSCIREIKDRCYHDQIDVNQFRSDANHPGVPILCDSIDEYIQELENRLLFDFTRLEQEFLTKTQDGTLNRFLQNTKFILIDEYQDTNLLQEQIYFEITKTAIRNGGSITVVGDDDQSLYRFRGATVDLFQEFQSRVNDQLRLDPMIVYLSLNYRSTSVIVDFCNRFITLDQQYQSARVQNKPPISSVRLQDNFNYPVLGMFRHTVEQLACDLGDFIYRVIHNEGIQVRDSQGNQLVICKDVHYGSPADIALLFSSPREYDSLHRPKLPLLLKNELNQLSPPIQVFNPRGQNLELIQDVQVLSGLILECIDPESSVQCDLNLPALAVRMFNTWRSRAREQIDLSISTTTNLRDFVNAWQNRVPLVLRSWDKREIPLIDLVYKLVTWIPNMQNNIEELVYLEAITRTINQAGLFGNFGGLIIYDPQNHPLSRASIREALWNIFMPLATGAIEINEELLETLPSDRINIMSIWQSKGLEFPLVIVDVGSDFRTNHPAHAFKRFPRNGGKTCLLEDTLRTYSPLGCPQRISLDRAFDDLIRLYFEAYSRAKDALLLIGLNTVREKIPNIATGWDREGNWHWDRDLNNLFHI